MKKLRPFLFATFFVIFLAFGFVFSKTFLFPVIIQPSPTAYPTPLYNSSIVQDSLLLIHVDNLEKPQPNLISAWAIFISNTEPVSVLIKGIYPPSQQITRKPVLADGFIKAKHSPLPEDFMNAIVTNGFKADNYLVMDNQAISAAANWINGKIPRLHSILHGSVENNKIIIDEEKIVLDTICSSFGSTESRKGPVPVWSELLRKNMRSDLYFDDALVLWNQLTISSPSPRCEIITLQEPG